MPDDSSQPDLSAYASALLDPSVSPNYLNPAYSTPEQRAQLYKYADALMNPQPVKNGWQGLGEMVRSLVGGNAAYQANVQEQASQAQDKSDLANTVGRIDSPYVSPGKSEASGPAPAVLKDAAAPPQRNLNSAPSTPQAAPPSAAPTTEANTDINPIAPAAVDYLRQGGVTNPLGAAALAAGFQAESGFDPSATRPGDGHDGSAAINIGQWNGPRAQAFQQFAAANGLDPNDPKTGLAFASTELHTTEAPALRALNAATSPEQATAAALSYFRPAGYTPQDPTKVPSYPTRLALTNRLAPQPLQVAGPGAPPAPPMAAPTSMPSQMPPAGPQGAAAPPQQPLMSAIFGGSAGPAPASNGLPVSGAAIGELLGNRNIPPELKMLAMGLAAPQRYEDAYGNLYVGHQNQPVGPNQPPVFSGGVNQPFDPLHPTLPNIISGNRNAPQSNIIVPSVSGSGASTLPATSAAPNGGTSAPPTGQPGFLDPGSPVRNLVDRAQDISAAAGAKSAIATQYANEYTDAQKQALAAQQASYPLRQLQAVLEKSGGAPNTGELAPDVLKARSIANMLGIGDPGNLSALELIRKFGGQAAQRMASQMNIHPTDFDLMSTQELNPNITLSPQTNLHLVDNLIRLNDLGQKYFAAKQSYYQQNRTLDGFQDTWTKSIDGSGAIPLSKYPVATKSGPDGKTYGKYPSTAQAGFTWRPVGSVQ